MGTTYTAVDLFAGPGGWSVAVARLGLVEYGVEWDAAACATAVAAGHHRRQIDVRKLNPRMARGVSLSIGSPPCQGFSMAGLGAGRGIMPQLREALMQIARGRPIEEVRAFLAQVTHDDRVGLVVEPMHWVVQAMPRTVVLEQVPAVLPLWEAMAEHMRELGYSVATGTLQAEQYDVPQTRKRAILIASLDREVAMPTPVRAKYRKGAEPDPSLPRWISMAEALGWGMTEQPSMTVCSGGTSTGGAEPFGNGARKGMRREQDAGRWAYDRPATTVQGDARLGRPGHKHRGPDCCAANREAGEREAMFATDSVRVTVQEAAVLQGFPADYPWQGTKTKQYEQVGNAVPPPLAWHVLRAALGLPVEHYPGASRLPFGGPST